MAELNVTEFERNLRNNYSDLFELSFFRKKVVWISLVVSLLIPVVIWISIFKSSVYDVSIGSFIQLHSDNSLLVLIDLLPLLFVFLVIVIRKHEFDKAVLVRSLNEKYQIINKNAQFAQKIGEGDYSTTLGDIDQNDVLGRSLIIMRDNLIISKTKENEENWIAKGKDLISTELRLHNDLNELANSVLVRIINYINVVQGAFYIYDEDKKVIENYATYAYGRKKYWSQKYKLGHGLIGQSAYEMATVYRTQLPENYVTVSSGILGDQKPGCVLIVPLITDDKLHGVIELASVGKALDPLTIRFVEELSNIIARTIFNLKVNYRTSKLLAEARQMTEELQENEEELRMNAEEMKASQEELERMNRDLELKITEVEDSEQRLHSLLENASEVISIYNPDGTVRYESPSVKNILGFEANEIVGTDGFSRVHSNQMEIVELSFARLLKNPDKPQKFEFKFVKKDGDVVWLESIGRNLIYNTAINGIIFNTRDITLSKLAEKEQRMRSRMQALSENSPDMIVRLGLNSEVYYANPKVQQYIGVNSSEIMRKSFYELHIREEYVSIFRDIIDKIKQTQEKLEFQSQVPSAEEERIMTFNAIPEYTEDKELESILVVAHDITDSKKIELEIKEKNKKITESINYALRIQSAILPDNKIVRRFLPNSFIFYKPKDVVSGDFPWFFAKGDYIYIAAVDCTGHGVPGALLSIIGYFTLNNIVDHEKVLSSGEILDNTHRNVRTALKQDKAGADARDGMDIAFCKINLKTRELEYSGAHRPLYMLRGGELIQYKGNSKAIGGIPIGKKPEKNFETHKIAIEKGDKVFFFSDGLPDQINDKKEKYSPARIRDTIIENSRFTMAQYGSYFEEDFQKWKSGVSQIDDVLLIGIEF